MEDINSPLNCAKRYLFNALKKDVKATKKQKAEEAAFIFCVEIEEILKGFMAFEDR